MAGMKKLINRTGEKLEVTLLVRQGDEPGSSSGSVVVRLAAGPDEKTGVDRSVQVVHYGTDTDIYLDGLEVALEADGATVNQRRIVVKRGGGLDNALNTNDCIEFLFDGTEILISATNSGDKPFSYAAED